MDNLRIGVFFLLSITLLPHFCTSLPQHLTSTQRQAIIPQTLPSLIDRVNANPLSIDEKRQIIGTAAKVLENMNPHLFLQLNFYKVDIVADLNRYAARLEQPSMREQTNAQFHTAMVHIFQRLNDRHTVYVQPPPFANSFAILPFVVRETYSPSKGKSRRKPLFVVSNMSPEAFPNSTFNAGVSILTWNGENIDMVIRKNGIEGSGSNSAAKKANAIQKLTTRSLAIDPIPKKETVEIEYETEKGDTNIITVPWQFFEAGDNLVGARATRFLQRNILDKSHIKLNMLVPKNPRSAILRQGTVAIDMASSGRKKHIAVAPDFKQFVEAFVVETSSGLIGHIVFPSFGAFEVEPISEELSRILKLMPKHGLVVDVRGNLGGNPSYVKAVIELLYGVSPSEMKISIRATDLVDKVLRQKPINASLMEKLYVNNLRAVSAIRTANLAGEQFVGPSSNIFTLLTKKEDVFNVQTRAYFGPVITVADGLTYSGGDLFANLQVDQNFSTLLTVSDNIGAGGASTIPYSGLSRLAPQFLDPLPGNVDFTTAISRFYRSGSSSGKLVEFFGVKPDIRYYPTLEDVVNDDFDLFEFLGKLLKDRNRN